MRKFFLTFALTLALTGSSFAGDTPIAGVAGCAPGLWYPESQVCVLDLSAPVQTTKEESAVLDTALIGAILLFRDIIF